MTRKYAKRKIKYWQLNKKEVDQLIEGNNRRINEILDKPLKDLLIVNNEKELELAWILPCSSCRHFNMNCRWHKDCTGDVNTGRGLKYFEERKVGYGITNKRI